MWEPLKIQDLKAGDKLIWNSSSHPDGFRTDEVNEVHLSPHYGNWLFVGPLRTPRQQDWLDNPFIQVRRDGAARPQM